MHLTDTIRDRLAEALKSIPELSAQDEIESYAQMVRPTADPKNGDYQINCAMALGKRVGSNPRDVANKLVGALDMADLCEPPEIAGPGFINLKFKKEFLETALQSIFDDDRCGVIEAETPKTIVIDYSSPNVAKPMHVGHIRSTVIGDCLARTLGFLGHKVITDNHLGDWGTQFGMIIYGYKHFGDPEIVAENPVPELAKLYRLVHKLMGYHQAVGALESLQNQISESSSLHQETLAKAETADKKEAKKLRKTAEGYLKKKKAAEEDLRSAQKKIAVVEATPDLFAQAKAHSEIAVSVLLETAKLHSGDAENLRLWNEFLPHCKDEINRVYDRLDVTFDHIYGESFYHPMLGDVVEDLRSRGLAKESEGAICVFLPDFDSPMIVQKRDGAFLYATTDLATLRYRKAEFQPDEILYVVDTRQGEHFDKLFAVAKLMGMESVKLVHVNFGTVCGPDGKPIKTRDGDSVGLESLLNDAVAAAFEVVCDPDRIIKLDPPMDKTEQREVAETVGIAAVKYADLGHDRKSDYKFDLGKMVALRGNTATYAQYSFARTRGILARNDEDQASVQSRIQGMGVSLEHPDERALALALMRFEEALHAVYEDYAPNFLVEYIYSVSEIFNRFNQQCHVLHAESELAKTTRLALVVATGRTIQTALGLLGIRTVRRM